MEQVNCDLCGYDDVRPYLSSTDRFSGHRFNLVICNNCGLIYLNPRPTMVEIQQHYPDDYEAYRFQSQYGDPLEKWYSEHALQIQLNYVERHSSDRGTLLDVGCATGNFLHLAEQKGWQVLGLEIFEKVAMIARKRYDLTIITQNLENVDLPLDSLDVITLWDVLEHVSSPRTSMIRMYELLRPGGMIYFSIPNLNSYDRRLFGSNWIGWDSPRHFTLYSNKTIKRLLDETGFEIIDHRCLLGGRGAFLLSIDRIIQKKTYLNWLKTIYPLISVLFWPYRQFAYIMQKGPIMYYAVRKI